MAATRVSKEGSREWRQEERGIGKGREASRERGRRDKKKASR